MTQDPKQVYDDDGYPVYGDDGKPLLETVDAAASPTGRSWLADMGVGAAKSLGQKFLDLGSLVHRIPGVSAATDALYGMPEGSSKGSFNEFSKPLQMENTAQSVGSYAPDAALALEGGLMSSGGKVIKTLGSALHKRAIPALTAAERQIVLSRGLGRATPRSVEALSAEAARTGAPRITSAAKTMERAAKTYKPWSPLDTFDLAARAGLGGYASTPLGLALGAAKLVSKVPRGATGQVAYQVARPLQGVTGGVSTLAAQALMRLFGADGAGSPDTAP